MAAKEKPEHIFQREVAARLREENFIIVDCDVSDGLKYLSHSAGRRFAFISVHKARGWTKGQPDLIIAKNGRVVLLELKYGKGKQSPEQASFGLKCKDERIDYRVLRSLRELEELIEEINRTF